jgi:hypothetical protein
VFSECYVKPAHSQCVNVVAIRKMASIQGENMETDVHTASSGMVAVDRHEVL